MKEKGTCIASGKCVGRTYRWTMEKTAGIRGFLGKAAQSITGETKAITAKLGNLFKKVKTGGQLAHWEMKQRDDFAKLGEEFFNLKNDAPADMLNRKNIKEIIGKIENDRNKINTVNKKDGVQKKRMGKMILLKRAVTQLGNPKPRMRRVAIRVLERLGKKEAIPHLNKLLDDPETEIRKLAQEAISKLSDLNDNQPAVAMP